VTKPHKAHAQNTEFAKECKYLKQEQINSVRLEEITQIYRPFCEGAKMLPKLGKESHIG